MRECADESRDCVIKTGCSLRDLKESVDAMVGMSFFLWCDFADGGGCCCRARMRQE